MAFKEGAEHQPAHPNLQGLVIPETAQSSEMELPEEIERLFIERVAGRFEEMAHLVELAKGAMPQIREHPGLVSALSQVLTDISGLAAQTLTMIEGRGIKEEAVEIAMSAAIPAIQEAPVPVEVVTEGEKQLIEELLQELDKETQEKTRALIEGREKVGTKFFAEFWGVTLTTALNRIYTLYEQRKDMTPPEVRKGKVFRISVIEALQLLVEGVKKATEKQVAITQEGIEEEPVEDLFLQLDEPTRERARSCLEGKERLKVEDFAAFWGVNNESVRCYLIKLCNQLGIETLPEGAKRRRLDFSPSTAVRLLIEMQNNPPVKRHRKKLPPPSELNPADVTDLEVAAPLVSLMEPGEAMPLQEAPRLVEEEILLPQLTRAGIEAIKPGEITLESLLVHLEERISLPPHVLESLRNTLLNEENRLFGMETVLQTCLKTFIDIKGGQEKVSATDVSLLGLALARRAALFFQGVVENKLLKAMERIQGPQGRPEVIRKPGFSKKQLADELFQQVTARAEQVRAIESRAQLVASRGSLNSEVFWQIDKELEKIAAEEINVFSPPFLKFVAGISISPAEGCYLSLYRKEGSDYAVGDGMKAYEAFLWKPEDDIPYKY